MGQCLSSSEEPPAGRESLNEALQNFPIPQEVQSRLTNLITQGVDVQQAAQCASQAMQLFTASKAAGKVIPKEELKAIYSHVDADLFDYIFRFIDWSTKKKQTIQEFIVAVTAMSSALLEPDEQLEIIFAVCDNDKNGVLDRDEFERFMKLNLSMKLVHLSVLLATKPGKLHLTYHLKEEFSEENIIFYTDVVDFEETYSPETANQRATEIVDNFIKSDARMQVNISAKVQKDTVAAHAACLQAGTLVPATLFDLAKAEVFALMELDTFERFKQNDTEIDAMIQDFFREIDVDRSGTISLQEFRGWMKKNPTAMQFLDTLGTNSRDAVSCIQEMETIEKMAVARLSAHVLARKESISQLRRFSEVPTEQETQEQQVELRNFHQELSEDGETEDT